MNLHPKIVDAIKKRAKIGPIIESLPCAACRSSDYMKLESRIATIEYYGGFVCSKCQREAGAAW